MQKRSQDQERTPRHSLEGPFECGYCSGPYAQWGRFGIPVSNATMTGIEFAGSFCTPECCAAHNKYRSADVGTDACVKRHQLIETTYGRTVVPAPPKKVIMLQRVTRDQWLPRVRLGLRPEENRLIQEQEMPLLTYDPGTKNVAQKTK